MTTKKKSGLRWIGGRNTSPASPADETTGSASLPTKLDISDIALNVSPRELDMLVAALRVAEVRRGWVLQIRGDSPTDPLSADEVAGLRHRFEQALHLN